MEIARGPEIEGLPDELLVERFVKHRSDEAFRAITERYSGLVFGVCRRRLGRTDLAEDASQTVFVIFSKKAPNLVGKGSIAGWLYSCAVNVSKSSLRAEAVRASYERKAVDNAVGKEALGPVLDGALSKLNGSDRDALILRYFQGYSLKEVGSSLKIGEDAARMRINRALERLRDQLANCGLSIGTAELTRTLPEIAGPAAHTLPPIQPALSASLLHSWKLMIPISATASFIVATMLLFGGTAKHTPPTPPVKTSPPAATKPTLEGPASVTHKPSSKSARQLSAKEAIEKMIAEFPGNWLWTQTAEVTGAPAAPASTSHPTVKLGAKGAFEIRAIAPEDGSVSDFGDWTANAEKGSFEMGSDNGQPIVLNYVSGEERDGAYKLLFKGSTDQRTQELTLSFTHKEFKFVIRFAPKAGSDTKISGTATSLFDREP